MGFTSARMKRQMSEQTQDCIHCQQERKAFAQRRSRREENGAKKVWKDHCETTYFPFLLARCLPSPPFASFAPFAVKCLFRPLTNCAKSPDRRRHKAPITRATCSVSACCWNPMALPLLMRHTCTICVFCSRPVALYVPR